MFNFYNISTTKFSINGRTFWKTFLPILVNDTHIRIVNIYDSRIQLIPNTPVSDIQVNGAAYANATDLINAIHGVIFSKEVTVSEQDLYNIVNQILSGIVTQDGIINSIYYWDQDYTYQVVYVKWVTVGQVYENYFNESVVLDAAHSTLDRIDIIALNTDTQELEVVTGTPASEPSLPALAENLLMITFVNVDASTTAPTGVTETLVYNENGQEVGGEFDTSTNNPTDIILNHNVVDSQSGSICIKYSDVAIDDYADFDKSTTLDIQNYSVLVFRIKLINAINHKLQISLRTKSPDNSIFVANVLHGNYGFDINNLSTWQTIVVPLHGNIVASLATDFDRIRITNKQADAAFLIDNVVMQSGTEGSSGEDGDFLPRGGYAGTAQNLKDEIDAIGATPGIITLTGDGVDNTDPDNPVMDLSNWQQTSEKGVANGYASLDSGGKVPTAQLPSYVDDVLEFADLASFPATGETGKIYIAQDTNLSYRWTGSVYVKISDISGSEIKTLLFAESDTNNLTDALLAKLNALQRSYDFAISDETSDLEVDAVNPIYTDRLREPFSGCNKVRITVSEAPDGAALQFDVHRNGSSIFSTLPTIDSGDFDTNDATTPQVISGTTVNWVAGDLLEVFVTQVGSTTPGVGAKASLQNV